MMDIEGADTSELLAQQEFLRRSLDDLESERDAGDIDPADYESLRARYAARAEAVDRALGEAPEPAGEATGRSRRGLVAIAVIVAFGVAAGLLLAHNAGTRLPGGTITGNSQLSPAQRLDLKAQQLTGQGKALQAIEAYDQALKIAPQDAEALAYKGWLLRLAGHQANNPALIDLGLSLIMQAEKLDPTYADPYFFGGETLFVDKNDAKDAVVQFQEFLANNPPQGMIPEVQGELQTAQQSLAGG